ncbi:hypothetical protein MRB53_037279 [Persea americana]|nr:hypothetical protein MRB53_037279 [Persea americana]
MLRKSTLPRASVLIFLFSKRQSDILVVCLVLTRSLDRSYKILLQKAAQLGDVLYAAFDTPNQIGSLSLELTRLGQLVGDAKYYDGYCQNHDALDEYQDKTKLPGLWPAKIDASGCKRTNKQTDGSYEELEKEKPKLKTETKPDSKLVPEGLSGAKSAPVAKPPTKDTVPPPPGAGVAGIGKIEGFGNPYPEVGAGELLDSRAADAAQHQKSKSNAVGSEKEKSKSASQAIITNDDVCIPQGLSTHEYSSDTFTLGAAADSTYEYLPKMHLLLGDEKRELLFAGNVDTKVKSGSPDQVEHQRLIRMSEQAAAAQVVAPPAGLAGGKSGLQKRQYGGGEMQYGVQHCTAVAPADKVHVVAEVPPLNMAAAGLSGVNAQLQMSWRSKCHTMLVLKVPNVLDPAFGGSDASKAADTKAPGAAVLPGGAAPGGDGEKLISPPVKPSTTTGDGSKLKPLSHEEFVKNKIEDRTSTNWYDWNVGRRSIKLRPEAIESVFYMYRITGEQYWRDRGGKCGTQYITKTHAQFGATAIDDVSKKTPEPIMLRVQTNESITFHPGKQYLVTRGVPCRRRLKNDDFAGGDGEDQLVRDMLRETGVEAGGEDDGWLKAVVMVVTTKTRTVTLEDFYFASPPIKTASVHPCKHASVMKVLLDRADAALKLRINKIRHGESVPQSGMEGLVDQTSALDLKDKNKTSKEGDGEWEVLSDKDGEQDESGYQS